MAFFKYHKKEPFDFTPYLGGGRYLFKLPCDYYRAAFVVEAGKVVGFVKRSNRREREPSFTPLTGNERIAVKMGYSPVAIEPVSDLSSVLHLLSAYMQIGVVKKAWVKLIDGEGLVSELACLKWDKTAKPKPKKRRKRKPKKEVKRIEVKTFEKKEKKEKKEKPSFSERVRITRVRNKITNNKTLSDYLEIIGYDDNYL